MTSCSFSGGSGGVVVVVAASVVVVVVRVVVVHSSRKRGEGAELSKLRYSEGNKIDNCS